MRQRSKVVRIDEQLDHVVDLVIEEANECQVVRTLLVAGSEHHERSVVFLGKELERGSILKRVNIVLFRELDRERFFERVLNQSELLLDVEQLRN